MNYYNEIDPKAAAWIKELIKRGLIPDGHVDTRSIADVRADDLLGYSQCHFFCGIAGWSLALQLAGWPSDRPVWTGSCPCQPFSVAGKGKGESDERHLWPEFRRLIADGKPAVVFGEQVASKAGRVWLSRVRSEMEELGYGVGAADLCAAGVGAPHIRQRLYWMAYAQNERHQRGWRTWGGRNGSEDNSSISGLAHAGHTKRRPRDYACDSSRGHLLQYAGEEGAVGSGERGKDGRLGDANSTGPQSRGQAAKATRHGRSSFADGNPWDAFDLLTCTDGKARRIEPGSFPLAHGVPARVVRLRGYGNAIVSPLAAEFIQACEEAIGITTL